MEKKLLHMEDLVKLLQVQLNNGGRADLVVTGISMYPMLHNRRDSVSLIPVEGPRKKGDIILYRRANGQYILHRIIGVNNGTYICCGDNQADKEIVEHPQLIAVVNGFTRGGKTYGLDCPGYRLYCFFWVDMFPLRQGYIRIRRKLGKLYRKLKYK